jgi:glutaredoxin 3
MTVEIWGKDACPSCTKAKVFVEQRNLNYVYKQMGVDFTREEVFENFPEARTFPQIKVNGNIVGGYEQFVKYVEDTGYTGTGHSL